jgi:hypothetical protein
MWLTWLLLLLMMMLLSFAGSVMRSVPALQRRPGTERAAMLRCERL